MTGGAVAKAVALCYIAESNVRRWQLFTSDSIEAVAILADGEDVCVTVAR